MICINIHWRAHILMVKPWSVIQQLHQTTFWEGFLPTLWQQRYSHLQIGWSCYWYSLSEVPNNKMITWKSDMPNTTALTLGPPPQPTNPGYTPVYLYKALRYRNTVSVRPSQNWGYSQVNMKTQVDQAPIVGPINLLIWKHGMTRGLIIRDH